jgi:hypothetical protein
LIYDKAVDTTPGLDLYAGAIDFTITINPDLDTDGDGVPDFVELAHGMDPAGGNDADGDGFVETAEGAAAAFGPIIASLTASGDVDPALGASGDFDVAEEDGRIVFSRSYTLDPTDPEDQDVLTALQAQFDGRIIKLHGLEVAEGAGEGTPGEVNGEGGYAALLPVAAGPLLSLPDEVVAQFADDPETLLDGITAFLDAVAPFTLKTDGSGAIVPDPFLADGANGDGTNGDGTNGDGTNGDGTNGDARLGCNGGAQLETSRRREVGHAAGHDDGLLYHFIIFLVLVLSLIIRAEFNFCRESEQKWIP